MSKTYSEKLRDPRWQKKRLDIFNRDGWVCQSCDRNCLDLRLTAHIHHILYLPDCEPWEYDDKYLATYCEFCHETEHLIGDQINKSLIQIITDKRIYIKPISQLCILTDKWSPFYDQLKTFLNGSMINYLESKKLLNQ